ncbi:MAG TPA: glycosyltransferase 87 family protein [Acidimicrobiales bacterium]|nr:glycosyltransferase 87 family protein [Acidimicrobiales bacterium]
MVPRLLRRSFRVAAAWSPDERDAVLYAASALFAMCTATWSGISLYQQWGRFAVGPYAFGALASALFARRARNASIQLHPVEKGRETITTLWGDGAVSQTRDRRPWYWTTHRTVIFLIVLVGATLAPLSFEVLWRTDSAPGTTHVQPETEVVEQAGIHALHHHPQYSYVNPKDPPKAPPGQPAYDVFNPYLPLMSVFGLPAGTNAPRRLTDARVWFSVFTILVVVVALALCRGPTGPRVLTLQAMTVLPSAALPLATGGDDVPIAALMLLCLVLLQRRKPLLGGVAVGVAASMKITAWPLAAIAILAARDKEGARSRTARLWYVLGLFGVMVPAVLPSAAQNLTAFVENVVRFPLGLAGMSSPAASPLLGHALVSAFPQIHRGFTIVVALAGAAALAYVLVRHTPRSPWEVSRLLAWTMAIAILLAPATRIGYAIYPVDFFVWTLLLRGEDLNETVTLAKLEPASSHRKRRKVAA